MKFRWQLISSLVILVALGGIYVFIGCVGDWYEQTPPLLYITTLPDASRSIAVADPSEPACSEPSFINTTITNVESVRWSSDYSQIEYVVYSSQYTTYSLGLMSPDGSRPEQVVSAIPVGFGRELIRLSSDHHYVAFLRSDVSSNPAQWEIHIVDTETDDVRQLMTGVWGFEWAPQDNQIAVSRWQLNDGALYIVQPDGTVLTVYSDVILTTPHWSPDGNRVAYSSEGELPVEEIYVLNINDEHQRQVTYGADRFERRLISFISWSPDGRQIAFVSHHTDKDGTSENNVLLIVDIDSGNETRLATDVEWSPPVWSSDGEQVAFISTMDGSNYGQVYTVDIATGTITQLTCDDRLKTSLSW